MNSGDILYQVDDAVARITLNRPEKLNAFTTPMIFELLDILDRADADDAVRCVLITGAGRAFSAGADLTAGDVFIVGSDREESAVPDWSDPRMRDSGGYLTVRMFDFTKPVICAINGAAVGMGATLTLAADFRLASTASKFAFPFVRRGIVPESASSWFLPRIVGISRALDWMLTGRTFPATEALEGGLVQSLHEPEDLLPAANALAREIRENAAPVSVALTRQLLWKMLEADHPAEAHRLDSMGMFARSRSDDVKEGIASFLEKRPPRFRDRVSNGMPAFYPWWPFSVR